MEESGFREKPWAAWMRCAPLCATITQHGKWVPIERGASIVWEKKKKAGSVSLWSRPPPCFASYLTNEPTKGPLHCLQRPIGRERWHAHMQLSPVQYRVCVCVRSHVQYCAHLISFSFALALNASLFSFSHKHTCTPLDRRTVWGCSSQLHSISMFITIASLLFCSLCI